MEREGKSGGANWCVMTKEQMEMLRKQISVYATICNQLMELYSALSSQEQEALSRNRVCGNPYFDPLVSSSSQKLATRHRWAPTAKQLQILEHMYEERHGTPNKQKIKEIAEKLLEHGKITETNVCNWFQNRRARSKRRQQHPGQASQKWRPGSLESLEYILFPSPDLGIEHLLNNTQVSELDAHNNV